MKTEPPIALASAYPISGTDPIDLYVGEIELRSDSVVLSGTGRIYFQLTPSPQTRLHMSVDSGYKAMSGTSWSATLIDLDVTIIGILISNYQHDKIEGFLNAAEPFTAPSSGGISHIIFHVVNFLDKRIDSALIRDPDTGARWRGRTETRAKGWHLTIDASANISNDIQLANEGSGYAITHIAKLRRSRNEKFDSAAASTMMDVIFNYLSLCRGLHCGPQLAVGYSSRGRPIWWAWTATLVEPLRFDWAWTYNNASAMVAIWPGIIEKWFDEKWNPGGEQVGPLRLVVYWYLVSNRKAAGHEAGTILAWVAFEILSWMALVEGHLVNKDGFKKLTASNQLRLLMSICDIPTDLPADLAELVKMAKGSNWAGTPEALAEIRNGIVHPEGGTSRATKVSNMARYEAWKLATWCLELVILRLLGYRGPYMNRITANVEDVPWNSKGFGPFASIT